MVCSSRAYVFFKTEAAAKAAVATKNGQTLKDSTVRVEPVRAPGARPPRPAGAAAGEPKFERPPRAPRHAPSPTSVFVGKLAHGVTASELAAHFAPAGPCEVTMVNFKVRACVVRGGGVTRCGARSVHECGGVFDREFTHLFVVVVQNIAFLKFKDAAAVEKALKLSDSVLKERAIKVEREVEKPPRAERAAAPAAGGPAAARAPRPPAAAAAVDATTVFVGGLSGGVAEEALASFFGADVTRVEVSKSGTFA